MRLQRWLYKKIKSTSHNNKTNIPFDQRTLAVNANSKDFLVQLGVWKNIKSKPQLINKIVIKDFVNSSPLIFSKKRSNGKRNIQHRALKILDKIKKI